MLIIFLREICVEKSYTVHLNSNFHPILSSNHRSIWMAANSNQVFHSVQGLVLIPPNKSDIGGCAAAGDGESTRRAAWYSATALPASKTLARLAWKVRTPAKRTLWTPARTGLRLRRWEQQARARRYYRPEKSRGDGRRAGNHERWIYLCLFFVYYWAWDFGP